MSFKITTITAFIGTDADDEEGLLVMDSGEGPLPMVCADEARIRSLYQVAEAIRIQTGMEYRIVQFSHKEDITDFIKATY